MPQIIHIETKRISARTYYGRFCVEPLQVGQGITLGNALRRALLGDLVGFAATSANIAGASHEFSTLPGIRESVVEILLNIKQIIFKQISSLPKDGDRSLMRASLDIQGPATVTAKDLVVPNWIKVVDHTQYIATLSNGAQLKLEIQLAQGTGYRLKRSSLVPPGVTWEMLNKSSEAEKENDSKLDTTSKPKRASKINSNPPEISPVVESKDQEEIPTELIAPSMADDYMTLHIDALFLPVTLVNYRVEEQVINGRRQEELMIDIWTNGSLSPRQALDQAVVILIRMLGSLQARQRILPEPPEPVETPRKQDNLRLRDVSSIPIESLDLSVRSYNCLKRANITNVGKLISYSREDLLQLKNFGTKSANEVVDILKNRLQLALRGEELLLPTVLAQKEQVDQKTQLLPSKKVSASERASKKERQDTKKVFTPDLDANEGKLTSRSKMQNESSPSTKSPMPKKSSKPRRMPKDFSTEKIDED